MIRPKLALATAALTALGALVGACSAATTAAPTRNTPADDSSDPPTGADVGPIDLRPIPAGEPLEPGRYAVPLWDDDGPARALVDVPAGYFSAGGWVIDDGHGTLAPDEFGDVLFLAGDLGRVNTWPCGPGRLERPGPGIDDLARALVGAHGRSTRPQPVTVDGRHGLYLTVTAPADLSECPGGQYQLISDADGDGDSLGSDLPRTRTHLWILDVDGQRVVAVARVVPGHTSHPAELVRMAGTARFVPDLDSVTATDVPQPRTRPGYVSWTSVTGDEVRGGGHFRESVTSTRSDAPR